MACVCPLSITPTICLARMEDRIAGRHMVERRWFLVHVLLLKSTQNMPVERLRDESADIFWFFFPFYWKYVRQHLYVNTPSRCLLSRTITKPSGIVNVTAFLFCDMMKFWTTCPFNLGDVYKRGSLKGQIQCTSYYIAYSHTSIALSYFTLLSMCRGSF